MPLLAALQVWLDALAVCRQVVRISGRLSAEIDFEFYGELLIVKELCGRFSFLITRDSRHTFRPTASTSHLDDPVDANPGGRW